MLKSQIRWILPLLVLAVLAITLVALPAIASHAASVSPDVMINLH